MIQSNFNDIPKTNDKSFSSKIDTEQSSLLGQVEYNVIREAFLLFLKVFSENQNYTSQ